ncbi:MAG: transglutaminase domain-containing protein [Candidatus Latescibacteria bacterium]|jgi:hypothetical protein|nr:transglutaminase domain-containing protein [Candidatus Latescibacterota bacterium]
MKIIVFIVLFFSVNLHASAEMVTTTWGGDAEMVYDTGFMHKLMKYPDGGVGIFNMELIENDAPGSGYSEKGVDSDIVWANNQARKILHLDDPRAYKAWFVAVFEREVWYLQASEKTKKRPLIVKINGNTTHYNDWGIENSILTYRWFEFPAEWLKKGENIIELSCPEAAREEEGWEIWLARADEFEEGGGNPDNVGKTSYKSIDGGKSWKQGQFGPAGNERAEYTIRLSLDRYVETGWLASPVIDLWKGDSTDFIVPLREIQKMRLIIKTEVPEGTAVEYYFRKGTNPQPFSDEWETYRLIGSGSSLDFATGGADLNRRYVQFKAVLSTKNPLKTPVIKSAQVTAELNERIPLHKNIYVVDFENPVIQYSSIDWEWEPWNRPEFKELRERENLDEVIAGSRTQFDAQVKLLDYVTKRFLHGTPFPEYPLWDALSILKRIETAGGGGYCLMFNTLLTGMCQAYGWQARVSHVTFHEICEVWNDELGKWIFLDADDLNNYNYNPETAEPLNMLELHNLYLDYYFPDRSIDWMNDWISWMNKPDEKDFPVKRGSLTHHEPLFSYSSKDYLSGFINAGFMRIVPRNNWYEKPYPKPLTHNSFTPWDGYINWYDDRTPPGRHYSWHTDRPRDMWPDLNKVHVDAAQGFGNDRLFLRFETYTPNFSHFEINVDDTGWKKVAGRWTWLFQSGMNTLRVRALNKLGAKGKYSSVVINYADAPFAE